MDELPIFRGGYGPAPYLLLGEAPNGAMGVNHPGALRPDRSGVQHTANRLLRFLGWTHGEYARTFDRANLLQHCPPRQSKGRAFPLDEARGLGEPLLAQLEREDYLGLVVLGKRAANAFRWWEEDPGQAKVPHSRLEYLTWYDCSPWRARTGIGWHRAVVVPHTSAINQWWNDEANVARFRGLTAAWRPAPEVRVD